MSARYALVLIAVTAGFSTGCGSTAKRVDERPLPAAQRHESEPGTARSGALVGRYSSPRVTGDYAGYPAVTAFIDEMAARHGFPKDYLAGVLSQAHRKQWTLDYLTREAGPTVVTPRPGAWTRYRSKFLTELHINGGVSFWQRHGRSLQRASERYGVPPEYILGIIGVETQFGRNVGDHRVLDALTTLAFDYPRRAEYFRGELEKFLLMTRNERIDPAKPVGSYAGAMGLGQFMPSSFLSWAVDFDGDGRRDLWQADDAVGSVANYFVEHGWQRGEPVVTAATATNANVQNLESGYDSQYAAATLVANGIRPAAPLPDDASLSLLRLRAIRGDEYWLGHKNFYVITRYNHSTHYAMAVYQLAQAIKRRYLESRQATR
ncbi:MAG: lytic murein transglycosylase B [Methylococcaceae bacterium]|nr:lytic murein transglycosylase B [Methylococcaceae bacterium]